MIPDPGFQNSMPYFVAADWRKSKTSLLDSMERARSEEAPV
jgi:hypothetical protein